MSRTPTSEASARAPTLWTTLRDFGVVVVACIAAAVALYALASPAHAGGSLPPPPDYYGAPPYGPPPVRAGWTACAPDVRRYCPNVLPGGGRILSCLAGNKDRLTLACHDALVRVWAFYRR